MRRPPRKGSHGLFAVIIFGVMTVLYLVLLYVLMTVGNQGT